MSIPIDVLEKIESVSALKVLIFFYKKSDSSGVIKKSLKDIENGSGIARNSTKKGLAELEESKLVVKILEGKGTRPNTYKVSKLVGPMIEHNQTLVGSNSDRSKTDLQGWKKSTGARKTRESNEVKDININNNTIIKDFKDINFINNDINSLSVVNENLYLTDEELGKLARRILVEWFLPLAKLKGQPSKFFFPQQMKILKDLLVKYRTEQVLASIKYWCEVNPPKDGMRSLRWLMFERKDVTHVMVALDYYKQQFVVNGEESQIHIRKVEEAKAHALEIVNKKNEEREKVKNMSNDDFLSSLLGGFGKIEVKKE